MSQASDDLNIQAASQVAQTEPLRRKIADTIANRNDSLPVARIPDDVYFQIFSLFIPSAVLGMNPDAPDTRAISQVNRRWRAVAIDLPSLWNRISLHRCLPYIQLMLQRTGSTAVHLDADLPLTPTTRAGIHATISPHAHRVRSFALRFKGEIEESKADTKTLLRVVVSSRVLESLFLSGVDVSYAIDGGDLDPPPKLHHLHLLYSIPQNGSPLLRPLVCHVRHISLSYIEDNRAIGLEWTQLLLLLGYMPLLESLAIFDTNLEAAHLGGLPGETVALHHLAVFRAERVRAEFLRHLLLHLDVPSTTEFRFINSGSGIPRLSPSVFAGAQRLTLGFHPRHDSPQNTVHLSAHVSVLPSNSPAPTKTFFLVPKTDPQQCLRDFGNATADTEALKTVQILEFHAPDADVGPLARQLVEHLQRCETLLLTRCSPALCTAVVVALAGGRNGGSPERVCPALTRLEISCTCFRDAAQARTLVLALRSMSDRRKSAGVARTQITLARLKLLGREFSSMEDLADALETQH